MADKTYQTKCYFDRGGDRMVIAPQGEMAIEGAISGVRPGQDFFADSVNGSSSNDGLSWATAKATIAQALALCTADKGQRVFVAPWHNEGFADAQLSLNVAGVEIIGLRGPGGQMPRIDYDHANASIDVKSSRVTLRNFRLLPSVTAVLIGIDIETGLSDVHLDNIEILPGEDGAGVDEFALGIDVKAACSRIRITNVKARQHASAAGIIAVISLTDASDDVEIADCDLVATGAGVLAPIQSITGGTTNCRIKRCLLTSDDEPGIEVHASTAGIIEDVLCFTNLATIAAAIVAAAMARYKCQYIEIAPESGAVIGTASIDD